MKYRLALLTALIASVGCVGPSGQMMVPGPGVTGPGPGVFTAEELAMQQGGMMQPGMMGPGMGPEMMVAGDAVGQIEMAKAQVAFRSPESMQVNWDAVEVGIFDSEPLIAPGRFDFQASALYRLKLSNIPGRPGVELYPSLELAPPSPRTAAYLAHATIPVQFTEEDFDQILSGNFVTKVLYLPDPEHQELAIAGVETLVSTRLDPGVDPVTEADRRGAILAIIRVGDKDDQVVGGGEALSVGGFGPGGPGAGYGVPMTNSGYGLPGPPSLPLGSALYPPEHIRRSNHAGRGHGGPRRSQYGRNSDCETCR